MSIQRFICDEDRSCEYEVSAVMRHDRDGDYVQYSDHVIYLNEAKLERDAFRAERDQLIASRAFYEAGERELFDTHAESEGWRTEKNPDGSYAISMINVLCRGWILCAKSRASR